MPALSDRVTQDLSESCFSHLKSALEVPRLYRRTNKVSALTEKGFEVGKCISGRPEREELVRRGTEIGSRGENPSPGEKPYSSEGGSSVHVAQTQLR